MKYSIQKYTSSVVIPAGSGSIQDSPVVDLNGLLRALVITPPATLTGSSYSVQIQDLNTFSALAAGSTATKLLDGNNNPLQIPLSVQKNNPWLTIAVAGDTAATGVLTSDTTNVSNADTVTIGAQTWTFKTNLSEAYATGTITDGNGTNVSDGDTVTVGSITYRWKTIPTQANDLFIGATADLSLTNLVDAINGTGSAGTNWFTGTQSQPLVSAGAVGSHATVITAVALGTSGNSIALSKVAASITLSGLSGGNLSGGVNSIANEVKVDGSSADTSLGNLVAAINGASGAGTKYSTATVANSQVTAGAVTSHATTVTADVEVIGGDSIATTTTATHLSWGHATLTGSGEASNRTFGIEAYIER